MIIPKGFVSLLRVKQDVFWRIFHRIGQYESGASEQDQRSLKSPRSSYIDAAACQLICKIVSTPKNNFFCHAANSSGHIVRLQPFLMNQNNGIPGSEKLIEEIWAKDGKKLTGLMEPRELIERFNQDYWIDNLSNAVSENQLSTVKQSPFSGAVGVVDFRTWTVNLTSTRQALKIVDLYDQVTMQLKAGRFVARKTLNINNESRIRLEHQYKSLKEIDGSSIIFEEEDYKRFTGLFGDNERPIISEEIADTILSLKATNPNLKKDEVRAEFPNLGKREFNRHWDVARERNSEIGRRGRKRINS